MSAIGSVSIFFPLPTALRHAGDGALMSELAKADPAKAELLEHRTRAAAAIAAGVVAHLELLRALLLDDERRLGHYWSFLSSAANGSPRPRRSASACSSVVPAEVVM